MNKLPLVLPIAIAFAGSLSAQVTLISEGFGGSNLDPLNGTTADVFSSAITSAGGSSTWIAREDYFYADGSIAYNSANSAGYLDLGSYINDLKGDASAVFTLESTITFTDNAASSDDQNTDRITMGFFRSAMDIDETFFTNNNGALTFNFRAADGGSDSDVYLGYGVSGPSNVGTYGRGAGDATHKFTTVVDLTTWDGSSNFGTVAFFLDDVQLGTTMSIGYNVDFRFVGFTENNNGNGYISDMTLSQIPEPSSIALLAGISGLALVTLRRRRKA